MIALSHRLGAFLFLLLCGAVGASALAPTAQAQSARFILRAEPDVIPANGISTTSIFVQVQSSESAIAATPIVRFATTAGTIENQASLSGGVARVLLRSANTPGTAVVTAFIGNSREVITVEFSAEGERVDRYLEVAAPYVAYGQSTGVITSAGKSQFDFGDVHIESDVRLDVDLYTERIWAQGNKDGVSIRQGRGARAKTLRGDRLFFDLQRRSGVIRRAQGDGSGGNSGTRQEFFGSDFASLPPRDSDQAPTDAVAPITPVANRPATPEPQAPAAIVPAAGQILGDNTDQNSPQNLLDNRETDAEALSESGAVASALQQQTPATEAPATEAPATEAPATEAPATDAAPDEILAPDGEVKIAPSENIAPVGPDAPGATSTQSNPLVAQPRPDAEGASGVLPRPVPYKPLPDGGPEPRIVELPPPAFDVGAGYWVAARRLRVFPRDEIQFERASIYYNGGKAFKVPLYVLPLDGSFNPTTDIFAFNSAGGLSVRFPVYYMASKGGTGAVIVRNDPGAGFSANRRGVSLELDQQYTLSPGSRGRFGVDQIGNGAPNFNFQHQLALNSTTGASFFLNVPRGRDVFGRAALTKDLKSVQLGLETFYDAPENTQSVTRGQFYARMRPKRIGKSGLTYTVSANLLAISRVGTRRLIGEVGGGIGTPGGSGPQVVTEYNPLYGQTLSAALQAPLYQPWRGAQFTGNLLTTAYNYSDGRRGVSPGVTLGYAQRIGSRASLRLDYTYDRSAIGLYGTSGLNGANFTNYLSASFDAQITPQIGFSTFASRSFSDGSLYGSTDVSYRISSKWRAGLFADYSSFSFVDTFNYGWSLGRAVGPRELSINYDAVRGRIYFQIGGTRY